MQVQESREACSVVLSLVACPFGEASCFDALEGPIAGIVLRTRITPCRVTIPFKAPRAIEVDAVAELQICLLAVLTPQPVRVPSVDVPIGVKCGDKNKIEFFKKLGDSSKAAVASDEGVGYIICGCGLDPLASMRAPSDEDRLARWKWLVIVCWVNADA